jgi:CRISPR-associated endonuclease/helicase Cas3
MTENLVFCYNKILERWFNETKGRFFINKAIEHIQRHWNDKNIFVIEAPTGYGKSTISAAVSLYSLEAKGNLKCIVAFPLRTLLEDQYYKFIGEKERSRIYDNILGIEDPEKVRLLIGKRYMHNPDSRYLVIVIILS